MQFLYTENYDAWNDEPYLDNCDSCVDVLPLQDVGSPEARVVFVVPHESTNLTTTITDTIAKDASSKYMTIFL